MNEELKIIIKTVTDEAKKNIAVVKKELEGVEKQSKETGKSLDAAMKGIAKGVTVAIGSVVALTAAMVKLGHSAQDINKGFGKLKSSFENAGSSAKEATKYYKELFGILGDHDRTIETGQSIARITTDPAAMNDYKNIMAGAVSQYGDGYNTEALSENISETIAAAKVTGDLERVLVEAGISADGFNNALAQTTNIEERELLIRNVLNGVLGNAGRAYIEANQGTILYNESQARLNITLAQAAGYTTPLLTSLNDLGSTLLTFLAPAIQTVAIYLTAFIQLMAQAIQWVGGFFGMFSSGAEKTTANVNGYRNAMQRYLNSLRSGFSGANNEINDTIKGVNELKRATMGFDELNVVSSQTSASVGGLQGGGGGGGDLLENLPPAPNPEDYGIGGEGFDFSKYAEDIEKAKKHLTNILKLVTAIGAGFLLWKIGKFLTNLIDSYNIVKKLKGVDLDANWNSLSQAEVESIQYMDRFKKQLKTVSGILLIIAGSAMAISGAFSAWNNGVDWKNLALMIGGVAVAITGVVLAFGKAQAAIATVVAGAAIFIVSLRDMIKNGASTENVIGLIAGALLILIPIIYAFNTALMANPIMAVVAAAAALVVGIGALIVEFANEEKAIKSTEEAQKALNEATEAATEAKLNYADAVDASEDALERLKKAEKNAKMSGEELFWAVENGTLDYKDLTAAQRELYKAYINNEQKQKALKKSTEELKEAKRQETIASFDNQLALAKESGDYNGYKKSVVSAYKSGKISAEDARDAIGKSMSEMSRDSQETFVKDIPDDIKKGLDPKQYETFGQRLSKWFGDLWGSIKKRWNNGTLFTGSFVAGEWVSNGTVPKMATGGIVTGSTIANIGEAGREAVLPLENNTGWMDTLADRIAARHGSPSRIVLKVDGKELGYAAIDSINNITKQTGELQLTLA